MNRRSRRSDDGGGGVFVDETEPAVAVAGQLDVPAQLGRGRVAEHLADHLHSGQVQVVGQPDAYGVGGQVVQRDDAAVAPPVVEGEDARVADVEHLPVAPAEFGALAPDVDRA